MECRLAEASIQSDPTFRINDLKIGGLVTFIISIIDQEIQVSDAVGQIYKQFVRKKRFSIERSNKKSIGVQIE